MNHKEIIDFWFREVEPKMWWVKDSDFDNLILTRFKETHAAAAKNKLFSWRETSLGRLAEIVVLDQFSRNMFRDSPLAFGCDSLALDLSREAVRVKADAELPTVKKAFMYMPFMHSESSEAHEEAVKLFSRPGLEESLKFELKHKAIIDRFGRYPHRNKILGRMSTKEEEDFLKQPGSSF